MGQAKEPRSSPSAQIAEPASPAKLQLIRRFMRATGLQDRLDSGSFLERYAFPGGPLWPELPAAQQQVQTFMEATQVRIAALKQAYAGHRSTYQREYESHLNWEFTEAELTRIVEFLESQVGQHYLEGSWRMDAYVGTNVEDIEEQIVAEATATLSP